MSAVVMLRIRVVTVVSLVRLKYVMATLWRFGIVGVWIGSSMLARRMKVICSRGHIRSFPSVMTVRLMMVVVSPISTAVIWLSWVTIVEVDASTWLWGDERRLCMRSWWWRRAILVWWLIWYVVERRSWMIRLVIQRCLLRTVGSSTCLSRIPIRGRMTVARVVCMKARWGVGCSVEREQARKRFPLIFHLLCRLNTFWRGSIEREQARKRVVLIFRPLWRLDTFWRLIFWRVIF